MRLLRVLVVLLPVAASLAVISACGGGSSGSGGHELSAVATTTHAGDLLRNVGGDRVDVRTLLGSEADPHGYEPRPSDVAAISKASLVVKSGGDLDEWLDELIETAGGEAETLTLIDSVRTISGDDGDVDPHWWQDPRNAVLAARAIEDALVRLDPDGRTTYERNAATYVERLRRLDRGIAACMRKVPDEKRKLVTTHDALAYFANRYDVEIVGAIVPSLSTQAQPSARDVDELVHQIRSEDVEAIFPETALNPKLEGAISREAGASVGDALWADSLGPEGSDGETYVEAMASNTAALVEGMAAGEESCRPRV
ncbi:MAG: zinc ABC transporter substrate-binding protein [Thermoleophilaceae bacterium]|nr:zinc ABC transporter substrate-binding protein [Thermoleophilaceae bacterium]